MKNILIIFFIICIASSPSLLFSQKNDSTTASGFIDLNGYYDTRELSILTINLMTNFPKRVQYFSLTNYQGANNTSDLSSLYSEQNIRWAITQKSPLDLTLQYVIRSGNQNDDVRFGIRYKLSQTRKLLTFFKKLNFFYSINPMLVQLMESTAAKYLTQIEHVYYIRIWPRKLKNKIYVSGFADQNFVYSPKKQLIKTNWVTEHQLGVNIIDRLFAVAEFRINDYAIRSVGLGYGLQYKITF